MANGGGNLHYSIKFNVDKTGLNQIKSSLQEIKQMTAQDLLKIGGSGDIRKAEQDLTSLQKSIREVETALDKAFNADLGTLNVTKFNSELKKLNLNTLYKDFSAAGAAGQNAFRNITTQVLTTNMQLKQTHSLIDNMATTMANTIKWGVASSVMNSFSGSVQRAYGYVKNLDSSLNDIRIVTEKSTEEMAKFAVEANNVAKELGRGTTDYTEAALIYYQQGLSEEEVRARAETTIKAANVTGQAGATVSEQLTAVWNGYKVNAQEAELYVDKLAAVAAQTAADLEELSVGMSKVASAANLMGVDVDQLNAQLATIVSVTRQAPESVGTALKTIYARMGDIEAGIDTETTLGHYTEAMASMGFNVLDINGKLRDVGEVIDEIGGKWTTMSRERQIALSQTMAGTRQYNNLLSLFDNWDMYTDALKTSADAAGTLQKQQDIYMDSIAAHLKELTAASEDLYDSLLDADSLNPLIDVLTGIVNLTGNFVDAIGGGGGVLLNFGAIATKVFSKQIASSLTVAIKNFQTAKENASQLQAMMALTNDIGNINTEDPRMQKLVEMKQEILNLDRFASDEEKEIAQAITKQTNALYKQQDALEERKKTATETYKDFVDGSDINKDLADLTAEEKATYQKKLTSRVAEIENFKNTLFNQADQSAKIQENIHSNEDLKQNLQKELLQAENDLKVSKQKRTGKGFSKTDKKEEVGQKEEVVKNLTKRIKELETENKALNDELIPLITGDELGELVDTQFEGIINYTDEYVKAKNKIQELLNDPNFDINSAEGKVAVQDLKNAIDGMLIPAIDRAKEAAKEFGKDHKSESQNIQKEIDSLSQKYKILTSSIDFRGAIEGTVRLIGSVGQLVSVFNSLKQIGSIIDDENLSNGEKFLQIVQNLSFSLPMLMSGLSGFKTNLKDLSSIIIKGATAYQAAQGIQTTANLTTAASFKILGKAALPYIGILAGIGIVVGLVAGALTAQQRAQEKVTEAYKNSLSEYEAVKTELNEINSQLETAQNRIKEINEMESLSITDKEELALLQAETAELKAQKILKEEEEKEKSKETAEDFAKTVNTGKYTTKDASYYPADLANYVQFTPALQGNSKLADFRESGQYDALMSGDKSYFAQYKEILSDAATQEAEMGNSEISQQILNYIEDFESLIQGLEKEKLEDMEENRAEYMEGYKSLLDNNDEGQYDAQIDLLKDENTEYYKLKGGLDTLGASVLQNTDIEEDAFNNLMSSDLSGENFIDNLEQIVDSEVIENIQSQADYLGVHLQDMLIALQESGMTYEEFLVGLEETSVSASQKIKENLTEVNSAIETLHAGDSLDEETVTKLEQKYKELGEIRDKDSRAYLEVLEKIQQIEEDAYQQSLMGDAESKLDGFVEKAKNLGDVLDTIGEKENIQTILHDPDLDIDSVYEDITAQVEEVQQAFEDIFDAHYEIDLSITDDIISDTQNLINEADRLQVAFASIGDGFQVSADASEDLFKVFPELAEGARVLADGTIQLNQEVVNTALQGQSELIDKDKEKTISNINNRIGELDNEIEFWEGKLEEVKKGNMGETELESIANQLQGEMDIEKNDIIEKDDIVTQQAIAKNDGETTMSIVQGWALREQAALQYAETAKAAMNGEVTDPKINVKAFQNAVDTIAGNIDFTRSEDTDTSSLSKSPEMTNAQFQEVLENNIASIIDSKTKQRADLLTWLGKLQYETSGGYQEAMDSRRGDSAGDPDKMGLLEEEADIYHDINIEIKQLDTNLEKLQDQEEKLFGQDLVNNLNAQLEILEAQEDAYRRKLELQQKEAAGLKDSLGGAGVTFNADGTVSNYNQILAEKLAAVNALREQYDAMSKEEQEAFKDTIEAAEESYEKFKEDLERYEEVVTEEIPESQQNIQEALDKEVELNVKKLNLEVELKLKLVENEKEWDEYKRKFIDKINEDDVLGNATADTNLLGNLLGFGVVPGGTSELNDIMSEIAKMKAGQDNAFGTDATKAWEELDKSMSDLMDHMEDLAKYEEQIHQAYLDMVDKVGEEFDEQAASYEYVGDLINHNLNLVKLIKGDDAYEDMTEFYEQMAKNNLDIISSNKAAADYYRQMMETETDPEAVEKWTELWKNAVSDLNSSVEEAVENIIDKYENSINAIFDALSDRLTNGLGLDYLNTQWELQNKNADAYLDTVNATFELQQLENKYLQSIKETDSASAQKSLNKLMEEEMKKLREKDKLSQYDIDRANAKYELRLKEIALEEAQQNKTQMRLRRDASGNYTYQFVADADAVAKAQEEVDKLKNDIYNIDKEKLQNDLENIASMYEEYTEKMKDTSLSQEEKEALAREYATGIQDMLNDNPEILKNLEESADMNIPGIDIYKDLEYLTNGGLQQFVNSMIGEGGFLPAVQESMKQMEAETDKMNASLDAIEQQSGKNFEDLGTDTDDNITKAEDLAKAQEEIVQQTIAEKDAVKDLNVEVEALMKNYEGVFEAANKALTEAQKLRQEELGNAADSAATDDNMTPVDNGNVDTNTPVPTSSSSSDTPAASSDASGKASSDSISASTLRGIATAIWINNGDESGWGNGSERNAKLAEKLGPSNAVLVQQIIDQYARSGELWSYWATVLGKDASQYFYNRFNTGGYTGDWMGSEGKWAILDKKELVLNATDTENILQAVNSVRNMTGFIDAIHSALNNRIANLSAMGNLSTSINNSTSDLNQHVEIEAHFPGVTDRTEIEQAFNNLINVASQRAYNTLK